MNTPEEQYDDIRSDKWHEMSTKQLDQQRLLIAQRLTSLRSVMSSGMVNATTIGINAALEHARTTIDALITKKLT